MRIYQQLSVEERELLFGYQKQGFSLRQIALKLGRSHGTLSRELKRNKRKDNQYSPTFAHLQAHFRVKKQRASARLKNKRVNAYVRQHLVLGWSPEQIAGRVSIDLPGESIGTETIYRYIYRHGNLNRYLWRYLTYQRRKRGHIDGRKRQKITKKIPEAKLINQRPKEVLTRTTPGHWETDLLIGQAKDKGALSVTVERVTRFVVLSKLSQRTAPYKVEHLITRLKTYPSELRQTITTDNGSENNMFKLVEKKLNLNYYFAHPYASWEKGTVENTNQRIRRYIKKGESIDQLSRQKIKQLEDFLNNIPRKCLRYKTPNEAMEQLMVEYQVVHLN